MKKELSRNELRSFVEKAPAYLMIEMEKERLFDSTLSFAAEYLGCLLPDDSSHRKRAEDILYTLLEHHNPIVREGAILGLSELVGCKDKKLLDKLHQITETDSSPGVRDTAQEAIDK